MLLRQGRQIGQNAQVRLDACFDPLLLDLDDHLLTALQACGMHLGDGGRSKRRGLEMREEHLRGVSELCVHDRLCGAGRVRRCAGLQSAELPSGSCPTRSGRVLSICPSLMNVVPSSVSANRDPLGHAQVCNGVSFGVTPPTPGGGCQESAVASQRAHI